MHPLHYVYSRLVDLLEDILESTVVFLQDGAASSISPPINIRVSVAECLSLFLACYTF
jgi:hypothetical protein